MANTDTTQWTNFVETAFDTAAGMYLTDMPQFRSFVDKRPVAQAMPGDVVTLSIHNRIAPNTTPLTEGTDVTPVAMPAPRRVSVTLNEYGNVVQYTRKLSKLAFTQTVASDIGGQLGENMGLSLDDLYRVLFDGASNKGYLDNAGVYTRTAPTTKAGSGNLTSKGVSTAVAMLRGRRAQTKDGVFYICVIHPDVAHDLRLETGDTAWQNPHKYVDTAGIYRGELGALHGARFIENPRSTVATVTDAGTGPDFERYNTYFFGRECAVEAVAEEPHTVVGPITDKLKRDTPVGWYGILGQSRYRENSLEVVGSLSSLESISSAGSFDPSA